MKKEKNTILIGETFTENKKLNTDVEMVDFKALNQCYDRPSQSKVYIFNKYERLLKENVDDFNILYYGVKSYNTFMITLHAIVKKDNKRLYLVITPSYNYYKEI